MSRNTRHIFIDKGNFEIALEYFNKCESIAKGINAQEILANLYDDMGAVDVKKGKDNIAIDFDKESLKIKNLGSHNRTDKFGGFHKTGTAAMGITSAFSTFGYLGVVFYFLFACFMKELYLASGHSDWALLAYTALLPKFMLTVSHSMHYFSNSIINLLIWSIVGLMLIAAFSKSARV